MDNIHTHGNLTSNNNSEMDEIHNCVDEKVWVNETVISEETKQGNTHNYVSIKDENIDNITVLVLGSELVTDYIEDKVCLNEAVISEGDIRQEPCDTKDVQRTIGNYLSIKDENIDNLTVLIPGSEFVTDYTEDKVCVNETVISGGYIKKEPCDKGDESESIRNNVSMKGCKECGEEYDLYCVKCPMLIRIFDSSNPDGRDNTVGFALPKNFLNICETPSGMGIVALRIIPKGVVFGPFKGLDSTKDGTVLKLKELVYTKDPRWVNWMQYIRIADQDSQQNLAPFQHEGGLYYRSECHINMGDELLVRWDSDSKESKIQDMEDSYCEPLICESLDNSYACTFCCVGYKSISHLKAHNSTCIEKKNIKDFCGDIIQCDSCNIYLDKKEYSDYHVNRCYKNNGKYVFESRLKKNREGSLRYRIHNGDRPFSCTLCPYTATKKRYLQQHIEVHKGDKPFACTLCPYKAKTELLLKQHHDVHSENKPFTCTLCPYKTKRKGNLTQHIAAHSKDRPFACTLCTYKARSKSKLKEHVTVHNDERPFGCTLCTYKARTNSKLKEHVAIHNGERPFACTLCPHTAKTKSNLKRHVALHSGDKPFACTICPYKTMTNFSLKLHIAVHNDNKPYACALCPYKTTTKSRLKLHITVHNDDRPFACAFCLYKSKTKANLKQHIAIHKSDNKPFACTLCPYKTTTNSNLKQHVANHNQ